jgi:Trypsin-co-occurring domain 1
MKDLVKFELESGGSVFVVTEITDAGREGLVKAGRGIPEEAAQSFEAAISSLSPIASSIVSRIISISNPPDEAAVEFGLTLKAESGFIITKMGGDANFKINLKWLRDKGK